MTTRMKTRGTRAVPTIRAVLEAAVSAGNVVRLFVPDQVRPRVIDGVPKAIIGGRDGRERVIVAVDTATECVEVRLPVDRIARAEWLDATGTTDGERSAGVVPELREHPGPLDPTHSGRQPTRARGTPTRNLEPTHSGQQRAKPGRPPRQVETARAGRPARPLEHPTEPEMPAIPASAAAGRARPGRVARETQPEIRKPTPR
ncbi:MAG: hypothetical protein WCJ30_08690 [Deltaproteobacteria bacterium]